MISLSAVAKREKNKLSTGSAFIVLIDIELPLETIRICYNTEDITWKGLLYQAFPFTIGEVTEANDDSDPNVALSVSNVSRSMQFAVEEAGGAVNTAVILRVVNTLALDADAELEEYFVVTKTNVSEDYITFNLGTEYSSRTRRPINRYMKNNCPFKYKDIRCGATSSLAECDHTLTQCRARNNSQRFGGFQGIDQKGVYING